MEGDGCAVREHRTAELWWGGGEARECTTTRVHYMKGEGVEARDYTASQGYHVQAGISRLCRGEGQRREHNGLHMLGFFYSRW